MSSDQQKFNMESSRVLNEVRIDQTRRELESLCKQMRLWIDKRLKADKREQYHTQLTVLNDVLEAAARTVEDGLRGVSATSASGVVYDACRNFDRRIVWLNSVWDYYREKFDQRDDDALAPTLAAADEVVWSCYAEIFRRAEFPRGTTPLPYIELGHAPHAIPRAEPPPGLKSDVDADFIKKFLQELPIPIIGLPVNCLRAPWWLVHLGHEVGHHVLYDLLPGFKLEKVFNECLESAVRAASNEDDDAVARWLPWAPEIFADLYSILCTGRWGTWAMAELEISDEEKMLEAKTLYPAPVVRLALMDACASELKLDSGNALASVSFKQAAASPLLEEDEWQTTAEDLQIAQSIAASLVGLNIEGAGLLKDLSGWDAHVFNPQGTVEILAGELREGTALPKEEIRGARLYTSASVAAWSNLMRGWINGQPEAPEAEEQRLKRVTKQGEQMLDLSNHVRAVVSESREGGTRSAEKATPVTESAKLGAKLGDMLLERDLGAL
jgi:hypothetical protein